MLQLPGEAHAPERAVTGPLDNLAETLLLVRAIISKAHDAGCRFYAHSGEQLTTHRQILECLLREGSVSLEAPDPQSLVRMSKQEFGRVKRLLGEAQVFVMDGVSSTCRETNTTRSSQCEPRSTAPLGPSATSCFGTPDPMPGQPPTTSCERGTRANVDDEE